MNKLWPALKQVGDAGNDPWRINSLRLEVLHNVQELAVDVRLLLQAICQRILFSKGSSTSKWRQQLPFRLCFGREPELGLNTLGRNVKGKDSKHHKLNRCIWTLWPL